MCLFITHARATRINFKRITKLKSRKHFDRVLKIFGSLWTRPFVNMRHSSFETIFKRKHLIRVKCLLDLFTHNVTHDVSCGALTSNDKMAFSWVKSKTSKLNSQKSAVNTYLFLTYFRSTHSLLFSCQFS